MTAALHAWIILTHRGGRRKLQAQLDAANDVAVSMSQQADDGSLLARCIPLSLNTLLLDLSNQVQHFQNVAMEAEYMAQVKISQSRALYKDLHLQLQQLRARHSQREAKVLVGEGNMLLMYMRMQLRGCGVQMNATFTHAFSSLRCFNSYNKTHNFKYTLTTRRHPSRSKSLGKVYANIRLPNATVASEGQTAAE